MYRTLTKLTKLRIKVMLDIIKMSFEEFRVSFDQISTNSYQNSFQQL